MSSDGIYKQFKRLFAVGTKTSLYSRAIMIQAQCLPGTAWNLSFPAFNCLSNLASIKRSLAAEQNILIFSFINNITGTTLIVTSDDVTDNRQNIDSPFYFSVK